MGKSLEPTTPNLIRSDLLDPLRELAETIPWMRTLGLPARFHIVLDANWVQRDLRWLLRDRRNPAARTAIQELAACRTAIFFAPNHLDAEICEHADDIAVDAGVSPAEVLECWATYKELIVFIRRVGGCSSDVDPDDVPYLDVCEWVGAQGIHSDDSHIPRMGGKVVDREMIFTLRCYSRAKSWHLSVIFGGVVATDLTWHLLSATLKSVGSVWTVARRLPPPLQALILAGCVAALAHPGSRAWLAHQARSFTRAVGEGAAVTGRQVLGIGQEAILKAHEARSALSKIEAAIGRHKHPPLRVLTRAVLYSERRPLTVDEIERKVLAADYKTRARDFRGYLRRVLRESEEFALTPEGTWLCSV